MRLADKIFVLVLLSLLLTAVACGQTEKTPTVTNDKSKAENSAQISTHIGESILVLQNNEGKCQLLFDDQAMALDIPWQCDFHRLPSGKVRVFPRDFYEAKNKPTPKKYLNTQIILIMFSKPAEENSKDCRTELQAIKIIKGKITKSIKMDNLAACPPFQWDEKNFTALFE